MLYMEFEAKTEKEAIQEGLKELGMEEADVKIEVLKKEKKKLFGIGGTKEKAKVRIFYKEKGEMDEVIRYLKTFLSHMDKNIYLEYNGKKNNYHYIDIISEIPDKLIGRNARILTSIQNLCNGFLSIKNIREKVIVDIQNYYKKRINKIIRDAVDKAKSVLKTKQEIALQPLNSYIRRRIYVELNKIEGVATKSLDTDNTKLKKIIISVK